MILNVSGLDHKTINEKLQLVEEPCTLEGVCGQRFLGAGMSNIEIEINGVPGNALGAYLNGGAINVNGNAQDAVGDTMNEGTISIHGNAGDAAGYAMRGGKIYINKNVGYRAGIHMKEYKDKKPVMVVGGNAGSFLGEYQAGGIIIVLNLVNPDGKIVGNFPCTGMHGGKLILRSSCSDISFPKQVNARPATEEDFCEIKPYLDEFCSLFCYNVEDVLASEFTVVTPNSQNPYKQMYVTN